MLDASAEAVEVLAERGADMVASAGGVIAFEVVASEDYAAFGAVVRGGVVADVEIAIGGAEEEVHADGVAKAGVEEIEGELDVAAAGAVALNVAAAGGDGAGAGELGDLGDDAKLGGAGAVGGGAILDGGGEGYEGGGGGLEAFYIGYAVGLGGDVLKKELEEGGFADVAVVVGACPVLAAGVLDGEDVFGVVDVVGGGGDGVGEGGLEGGFEVGGGGDGAAVEVGVLEVEVAVDVGGGAVEADRLAEGEGYLEVGVGAVGIFEDDGGGGVEGGSDKGYGVILELAGAGGAGAGVASGEDGVEGGVVDGVASVVLNILGEVDEVGATGAVEVLDFVIEGIDEIGAVGGEIGVGVEAGGDGSGGGLADDIERQ